MSDIDPYKIVSIVVNQGITAALKYSLEGKADVFIYLDRPLNAFEQASLYKKFHSLIGDTSALQCPRFDGDKLAFEVRSAETAQKFVEYVRTYPQKLADEADETIKRSQTWLAVLESKLTA